MNREVELEGSEKAKRTRKSEKEGSGVEWRRGSRKGEKDLEVGVRRIIKGMEKSYEEWRKKRGKNR